MRRKWHPDPPFPPVTGMTGKACTIAVSEMSGVPAGEICNWVLVVSRHNPDNPNKHAVGIIAQKARWTPVAALLRVAAARAKAESR